MSLLDIGSRCAFCATVDFLPVSCPTCSQTFCRAHLHSHSCNSSSSLPSQQAGTSCFGTKAKCERKDCDRPRIEAIAGIESEPEVDDAGIAKQVRCPGCGGAFCTAFVLRAFLRRQEEQLMGEDTELRRVMIALPHWTSTPDTTRRNCAKRELRKLWRGRCRSMLGGWWRNHRQDGMTSGYHLQNRAGRARSPQSKRRRQ